ncbi:MAG TPA: NADH-quinone oxidoreductase subunit D, partial [Solirubrobacterales bacterium]|nr:NADH-quinone oxidoreductase subunit D [Solirubrobacterales bacterium]
MAEAQLDTEVMTINIGPHHPATHGVLRLVVDLEGEIVRDLKPVIGYVHTGIEKSCEDKSYWKVIPFVERMDYVSYFFQMEAFCGAVERL